MQRSAAQKRFHIFTRCEPNLFLIFAMDRLILLKALADYRTRYRAEHDFIGPFRILLAAPDAYQRSYLPGHITASAWIADPVMKKILLTHHAKLDRWLQPGGHADGNENVLEVAQTEAFEETGLKDLAPFIHGIFDLDIHPIPARTGFPQHVHYDVRFLFTVDADTPIVISHESHDLRWIDFDEVAALSGNNASIIRMLEKTKKLFTADEQ